MRRKLPRHARVWDLCDHCDRRYLRLRWMHWRRFCGATCRYMAHYYRHPEMRSRPR